MVLVSITAHASDPGGNYFSAIEMRMWYRTLTGLLFVHIGHPMKPHRVRMCHTLVTNYGLYKKMDVIVRQQLASSSRFVSFAEYLAGTPNIELTRFLLATISFILIAP